MRSDVTVALLIKDMHTPNLVACWVVCIVGFVRSALREMYTVYHLCNNIISNMLEVDG